MTLVLLCISVDRYHAFARNKPRARGEAPTTSYWQTLGERGVCLLYPLCPQSLSQFHLTLQVALSLHVGSFHWVYLTVSPECTLITSFKFAPLGPIQVSPTGPVELWMGRERGTNEMQMEQWDSCYVPTLLPQAVTHQNDQYSSSEKPHSCPLSHIPRDWGLLGVRGHSRSRTS